LPTLKELPVAGLEFPTQKKPEAQSAESAFGGLPTPAWAMAKPKAAAAEKKQDAAPSKKSAGSGKPKVEKEKLRHAFGAVLTLEALLALVAVAAFAIVIALIYWFWPDLNWMIRRYL
jgi:hypothetical protein